MPDWRTDRGYPKASAETSREHWAWEFLRRNPEYQARWRVHDVPQYEAARWGLLNLVNPEMPWTTAKRYLYFLDACPKFLGHTELRIGQRSIQPLPFPWTGGSPHEYAVVFDITKPLAAQFERATEMLQRKQTADVRTKRVAIGSPIKPRPTALQRYLRLMDAIALLGSSGESRSAISRVLYGSANPTEVMAKDIKAARHLRDRGYRAFLLLADRRTDRTPQTSRFAFRK
jgi:hypothetical protein